MIRVCSVLDRASSMRTLIKFVCPSLSVYANRVVNYLVSTAGAEGVDIDYFSSSVGQQVNNFLP